MKIEYIKLFIIIKTNNKQDDLLSLNELIEESKEREKFLEENIKEKEMA